MIFWSLWIIDLITTLIAFFYFFVGLSDGSVYSSNGGMWFGLLAGLTAVVAGSLYLRSAGKLGTATTLLAVVAIPALLFVVFILIAHFGKVKWN